MFRVVVDLCVSLCFLADKPEVGSSVFVSQGYILLSAPKLGVFSALLKY